MFLPRAPMATPGYFSRVGEGVGRAIGPPLVEPQPEVRGIGSLRLVEAGLVGQAQIVPAVAATVLQARVRGDRLEQVERTEGVVGQAIPEPIVAAGPDQPHVAALDLVRREGEAIVDPVKIVLVGRREGLDGAAGDLGLVLDTFRGARCRDGEADPGCEHDSQDGVAGARHAGPRSCSPVCLCIDRRRG